MKVFVFLFEVSGRIRFYNLSVFIGDFLFVVSKYMRVEVV